MPNPDDQPADRPDSPPRRSFRRGRRGDGSDSPRPPARWLPEPGWLGAAWRPLAAIALLIAGVGLFEGWLASCGFDRCPSVAEIRAFQPAEGGRILDRAGKEMGQFQAVRRINVPLDAVPEHVREAFVATEDRRFYDHHGVDLRGVVRAALANVRALSVREGFSTITMQAARNTFLSHRFPYTDRSLRRKLIELRVAALMERALTKDEILDLYLNVIYLGNGTYGVEAASRDLFGRSVEHLGVAEAAMLAALPKGPSAYTPRRDPVRARARRDLVLGLMASQGYITAERAASARRQPLRISPPAPRDDPSSASYALDAVRAVVDSVLGGSTLKYGDLVIHTTLDRRAQRAAERAVTRQAAQIQRHSRRPADGAGVEGAMVAIDPTSGGVRALVGGRAYRAKSFNRALAARRQPGSAFKPFVYAAALAAGYTPMSMVDDAPVEVEQDGQVWRPANSSGEYLGPITLRRALMRSSNSAAVRLARAVGERRIVERAHANGIMSRLDAVPSIALGSLEVTPLELVTAYAPFANGGSRVTPHLVRRIETSDGTVLYTFRPAPQPVMDPRDAFQLTSMLEGVVDAGTGSVLNDYGVGVPVAGKTGTTNNGADVWFVGYTPSVVAGFWFGYDTPRSLGAGAAGGRFAAPAWAEFYKNGWNARADRDGFPVPDGLVAVEVDPNSGLLAGDWCGDSRTEWFKPGTEPTSYADCEPEFEEPSDVAEHWLYSVRDQLRRALKGIIPRG
ncbi:MAG: transglycosylase domain-containing protein [Gemmatimonadaceae bacterium]